MRPPTGQQPRLAAVPTQVNVDAAWWIANREAATTRIIVWAATAAGAPSIQAIQQKIIRRPISMLRFA
jgi:hypothetical protein